MPNKLWVCLGVNEFKGRFRGGHSKVSTIKSRPETQFRHGNNTKQAAFVQNRFERILEKNLTGCIQLPNYPLP